MPPLRQRMLEDMAIRNLAENTQPSYIQQIILYAKYFHRAPEDLGPEEIRAYQLHLTQTRRLSASSVSATGYGRTMKAGYSTNTVTNASRVTIDR